MKPGSPKQDNHDDIEALRSEGDLNISPRRKAWAAENIDAETGEWLRKDEKYFLRQSLSTPCLDVLSACDGINIQDLQGRRYMDFHGNSVHQVGFRNPRVMEAIRNQLETLPFCPRRYTNIPAIRLAEKLAELAPGNLNKVLFAPGGAEAMGMALKLARMATGRFKTVSMWDSFHGASLDAISIGGEAIFRSGVGPLLPGAEHVPPPDPDHCPWECGKECNLRCAGYLEYVLEKEGDVGAVIAETVRSTPYIPPPEYWQKVRKACDRHGALLILDEIPNCLGRTGKMFACEHYGVVPDMLVIGKGLGGGVFPLAALIAREDLDIAPDRALGHYTHEKNPVACAAGLATIECIEEEALLENARKMGERALARLQEIAKRHALIASVRGLGLLIGVELMRNTVPPQRASQEAEDVMYRALEKGLSFKLTMGNIITLTPPLTITQDEMDRAIDILDACLKEQARNAGFQPAQETGQRDAGNARRQDASATDGGTADAGAAEVPVAVPTFVPFRYDAVTFRERGYLPHWEMAGATYSVTFRLADSLPQELVRQLKFERTDLLKTAQQMGRDLSSAEKMQVEQIDRRFDDVLDAGHGACDLARPEIAEMVSNALQCFEGRRYTLLAACVMPNHVHVVFAPLFGHSLADILHSWKSFTSKEANKILGTGGRLWEREYFDRLIRNTSELERAVRYVLENPSKAGLKDWKWVWVRSS